VFGRLAYNGDAACDAGYGVHTFGGNSPVAPQGVPQRLVDVVRVEDEELVLEGVAQCHIQLGAELQTNKQTNKKQLKPQGLLLVGVAYP